MKDALPLAPAPELIFGLVGPIGVDLDLVTSLLADALRDVDYSVASLRVTKLMREIPTDVQIVDTSPPYIASFRQRISYANKVRERLERSDAMAILAISAIRQLRKQQGGDEETPLPSQAYIVRQFKRPEEIKLLRSVYGRQFIQISAYAPQQYRITRIAAKEKASRGGLVDEVEATTEAHKLVMQDDKEVEVGESDFGQNVRDAFPLGDVFIDTVDRGTCRTTLERFVNALFGNNEVTPTHDEYGMYVSKSASLRSAALTRQVGAAIFRDTGEIISMGCNEVPKAGGGTYWSDDPNDRRDIVEGYDPNEQKKSELLADLIDRLLNEGHLSSALQQKGNSFAICNALLNDPSSTVKDSKVMDLLEFGRDIHAEMSAICDAARNGISLAGSTLYTTTFPCHLCAKHIVASGVCRVVYLEPYPKSYARELHSDSIDVEGDVATKHVNFTPFIGISPYRYRDLFEKGRRKYGGSAQQWNRGEKRPMIEVYYPSYFESEVHVVKLIEHKLREMSSLQA
jgi:deoxycytidylate deaminase